MRACTASGGHWEASVAATLAYQCIASQCSSPESSDRGDGGGMQVRVTPATTLIRRGVRERI